MADYTLQVSDDEIARYRMMAANAVAQEAEAFAEAGIVEGAVVADVGCGPAAVAREMGLMVGETGRVIGVERSDEALAAARQLLADGPSNVELRQGSADATGIEPGSVDVVMMRHVLAHNGGDEQAIVDHLATLPRSGGSVYLLDVDLTAMRVVGGDPDLDDLFEAYTRFHRDRGNDPSVGLRLRQLVEAAGLVEPVHRGWYQVIPLPPGMGGPAFAAREAMLEQGTVTREQFERWEAAMARQDARVDRPTVFAPNFTCVARVP